MLAADSEEQQRALALLQTEMLAFILEGVTERIERGDAPALADAVAAAIARRVEAAIDNGLRRFDLPTATRIAEEAARIARAEAATGAASLPPPVFDIGAPDAGSRDDNEERRGWRPVTIWSIGALLLVLVALAGWFAWQQSRALEDETAARTRIAVERDALSGERCQSAHALQGQVARLRNTDLYKANCVPPAAGAPDFCQAVDALDRTSRPGADCSRP